MSIKGKENTGDPQMQTHTGITNHIQQGFHVKGLMSIKNDEHTGDPPAMPLGLPNQGLVVSREKGLKPTKVDEHTGDPQYHLRCTSRKGRRL